MIHVWGFSIQILTLIGGLRHEGILLVNTPLLIDRIEHGRFPLR